MSIELTKGEMKWCREAPQILRQLAEFHECEQTAADAMGEYGGKYHGHRKQELLNEAKRLEDSF